MVGADGSGGETGPPGAGNREALSLMWGKESALAPPAPVGAAEEPGSAPSDVRVPKLRLQLEPWRAGKRALCQVSLRDSVFKEPILFAVLMCVHVTLYLTGF